MTALAEETKSRPDPAAAPERLTPRELRAERAAARRGLILSKTSLRCGGADSGRYDLLYERYNQPAATNLKLTAVETWLGLRGQTRN